NTAAQSTEGRVSFSVDGANGSFPAAVLCLEGDRAMVCLYGVQVFVPEGRRDEVARRLPAINFPLKIGAVQLNAENGELSYRMTQLLPEDEESAAALVNQALLFSAHAMDGLLQTLISLCCA
ncbi:MAG: hypothetical protein RR426_08625, partial [Oscillospiraceae bacterium]